MSKESDIFEVFDSCEKEWMNRNVSLRDAILGVFRQFPLVVPHDQAVSLLVLAGSAIADGIIDGNEAILILRYAMKRRIDDKKENEATT